MNKTNRAVANWEVAGIPLIFFTGSLLHFAYGWLGSQPVVGIFAAVNESVWEHLKLAFWPSVLYGIVEYAFLRKRSNNFGIGKAAGIWSMPILIVVLFYTYTAVLGHHVLLVDILVFFVAVALGQLASYLLLTARDAGRRLNLAGLLMLLLLAGAFYLFTFAPPQLPLFRDAVTGRYGIE